MIESIKDYASLLLDEKGNVKHWNKSAEKIKGYTAKEIIGKNFSIFYTIEDKEKEMPAKVLEEARRKGFAVYEGWRVRKNGSTFWGEIVINALYDDNEKFTGFSEVTRDLTQKYNAAEFEHRNIDALINNTQDLMWSIDREYKLVTFNAAFDLIITQITGKKMIRGGNALELGFGKETERKYKSLYERAFKGEIFKEIEYSQVPQESWSEVSFYPIRKGDEIIGTACYTHDITERKRTLRALEQNEHRFRSLIEHSDDVLVILSASLTSTYISPSINKVLGYTEHEAMGMDFFPLIHKEDIEELEGAIQTSLSTPGKPISYSCRVKHKDDSWKWMEGTMTNMLHDAVINGIVDNFRDITERKNAEIKMLHANRLYAFISEINQTIVM